MSYLHFISLWCRVARERQNFERCVICISCVEGFCWTRKTRCGSPTTCGCFWCKFGVRDRTGSLCFGRLDGVRNGWNSCPSLHTKPREPFDVRTFLGKRRHRLFSHNQEPLACLCLHSAITKEPIAYKDPSNRLRPLQNSR